jgi:murein DD-endopeptidase MepM/ murein hydrolase activator NlpD
MAKFAHTLCSTACRHGRATVLLTAVLGLSACSNGFDLDMRGAIGGVFSTAEAANNANTIRPDPDDRGVLSYPNYQVAVARDGDTLASVADRVGLSAKELARYNGIKEDDPLRLGEVIALPVRVSEPSPATGAAGVGPIQPLPKVDITTIATTAIDASDPTPVVETEQTQTLVGDEPTRHRVERGETAYSLSRRYGVTVKTLAQWNGLDASYTLRTGQYLLIPAAEDAARRLATPKAIVIEPGQSSITPPPPSALQPLPDQITEPVSNATQDTKAPDLPTTGASQTKTAMLPPVDGNVIRDFVRGRSDGIFMTAAAGSDIRAADAGIIGAVTSDQNNQTAIVIKHENNLLTAYSNVGNVRVSKGDRVTRGQVIGSMRPGSPPFLDFRVYRGSDSVDPNDFIQ